MSRHLTTWKSHATPSELRVVSVLEKDIDELRALLADLQYKQRCLRRSIRKAEYRGGLLIRIAKIRAELQVLTTERRSRVLRIYQRRRYRPHPRTDGMSNCQKGLPDARQAAGATGSRPDQIG